MSSSFNERAFVRKLEAVDSTADRIRSASAYVLLLAAERALLPRIAAALSRVLDAAAARAFC